MDRADDVLRLVWNVVVVELVEVDPVLLLGASVSVLNVSWVHRVLTVLRYPCVLVATLPLALQAPDALVGGAPDGVALERVVVVVVLACRIVFNC